MENNYLICENPRPVDPDYAIDPARPYCLHIVDIQRLQTERDVQCVGATDHLLYARQPGNGSQLRFG